MDERELTSPEHPTNDTPSKENIGALPGPRDSSATNITPSSEGQGGTPANGESHGQEETHDIGANIKTFLKILFLHLWTLYLACIRYFAIILHRLHLFTSFAFSYIWNIMSSIRVNISTHIAAWNITSSIRVHIFTHIVVYASYYIFLILFVVLICIMNLKKNSGSEKYSIIDVIYFNVVTFSTTGYGDITPDNHVYKIWYCFHVIVSVSLLNYIISSIVSYIIHSLKINVGYAFIVVISSVMVGVLGIYFFERLNLIDSIYLTVMSLTSVGYEDKSFKSMFGRIFVSMWLPVSMLPCNVFLVVVPFTLRRYNEQRRLQRNLTTEDSTSTNMNDAESTQKYKYVLEKFIVLGRITREEVAEYIMEFNQQRHGCIEEGTLRPMEVRQAPRLTTVLRHNKFASI